MKSCLKIFFVAVFAFLSVNAFAQKIGHISFVELIQVMPETAEINKKLETLGKTYEEELEAIQVEMRNRYVAYESNRATLSEAEASAKLDELDEVSRRHEARQAEVEQEFQQKQDEMFAPVFEKAQNAINKVAKDNGVAFIYNSQVLLYADETTGFNLLPLVKKELGIQ